MLEPGDVEGRIASGDVLVAGDHRGSGRAGSAVERVLGTTVLEPRDRGAHVVAIAVRRRHRDQGLGRAMVDRALERNGQLSARFDEAVRPFYESLGFAIAPIADGRYRGLVETARRG